MTDVIIVGAGPTGLTLGILLAQRGYEVTIFEKHNGPYPLPRAVHFDDEVGRILQKCGLGALLPVVSSPGTSYEWQNGDGLTLLRFSMALEGRQGWPQANMFNQPQLEAGLLQRFVTLQPHGLQYGSDVIAVTENDGSASVHVRDHSGEVTIHEARYIVGCDGANSTVRDLLGIDFEDQGFFFDWLVVDVQLHEPQVFEPSMLQVCDPKRPTTLMPGGDPSWRRWEFMALPDEDVSNLATDEKAWELLRPWGVDASRASLIRRATYRFRARWATTWRRGSIFLAGDAAHQTPPFAGQGMCAGMRDAANLAFKLDVALQGYDILDSYQDERLPHVSAVIQFAMELGKVICVADETEAAARDAMLVPLIQDGEASGSPELPPLLNGLLGSGAGVGTLAPQGVVTSGGQMGRLDDLVDYEWLVLSLDAVSLDVEQSEWFAARGGRVLVLGVDVIDSQGTYGEWLNALGCRAALQRPDFHVFATSSDGNIDSMIESLRRALGHSSLT